MDSAGGDGNSQNNGQSDAGNEQVSDNEVTIIDEEKTRVAPSVEETATSKATIMNLTSIMPHVKATMLKMGGEGDATAVTSGASTGADPSGSNANQAPVTKTVVLINKDGSKMTFAVSAKTPGINAPGGTTVSSSSLTTSTAAGTVHVDVICGYRFMIKK